MSFGTPVVFESADSDPGSNCQRPSCFDPDANRVVIAYKDVGDSNKGKAIVGSVNSGTESISFGTAVEFESGSTQSMSVVYDTNVDRVLIAYTDAGDSDKGKAIVGTVTAGTNAISFGAIAEFETNTVSHKTLAFDPDTNKILIVYDCRTSPSTGSSKVATITGGTDNTVAFGSKDTWDSGGDASEVAVVYDESVNKFLIVWRDEGDSGKFKMIVGTISGTDMTYGTEVEVSQDSPYFTNTSLTYYPTVNASVAIYKSSGSTVSGNVITISGTTPANTTSIGTLASGTGINQSNSGAAYDPDLDRLVFTFENEDSDFRAGMITAEYGSNLTTSNFIGIAAESISDTATGKITINGGINENQSSLTIGTNYFATDAGLVATSGTQLIGKAVAADKIQVGVKSGTVAHNTVALDANAKLPAVDGSQLTSLPTNPSETSGYTFVADGAISAAGKSVALTTDGKVKEIFDTTTASLASTQELVNSPGSRLGNNYFQVKSGVYCSEAERVVICYIKGGDSKFYAEVVEVGATSMGSGTEVEIDAGGPGHYCVGYDNNTHRVVVFFQDPSNSNYGTARVGTVTGGSGTENTVSWGTAAVFESGTAEYIASAFDTTNNKFGVFYSDGGDSDKGKGLVATVTGGTTNTIAFGSATEFESGAAKSIDATFMANRDKCMVFYSDNGNSTRLTATAGTISGTSISFTTPQQMFTQSSWDASVNYHSQSQHALVTWFNDGQDDRAEAAMAAMDSSGSISFTSSADVTTTSTDHVQNVVDTQSGTGVVIYRDNNDSGKTKLKPLTLASDGGTITVGSIVTVESGHGSGVYTESYPQYPSMVYADNVRRVLTYFDANGSLNVGNSTVDGNIETRIYRTALTSNEEDFIGIAQAAVSSGANVDVKLIGQIDSNQSGLTAGTKYYLSQSTVTATSSSNTEIGRAIAATKLLITNAG